MARARAPWARLVRRPSIAPVERRDAARRRPWATAADTATWSPALRATPALPAPTAQPWTRIQAMGSASRIALATRTVAQTDIGATTWTPTALPNAHPPLRAPARSAPLAQERGIAPAACGVLVGLSRTAGPTATAQCSARRERAPARAAPIALPSARRRSAWIPVRPSRSAAPTTSASRPADSPV